MRHLSLPLLLLLAACPQAHTEDANAGDDGSVTDPGGLAACGDDVDCELAGRTCCECPTFALAAGDPKLDACDDVMCPPAETTCSAIRAVCVNHLCAVACEPVATTKTCADGFAADAAGCLIDECAAPDANACEVDDDCVETRADCCGCDRGGSNTAVPVGQRDSFDDTLGCTGGEQCPEVSTCRVDETPQCAQGTCKLIAGGVPPDACGRPDLPACTNGAVCTVNASGPATEHGVGVCR